MAMQTIRSHKGQKHFIIVGRFNWDGFFLVPEPQTGARKTLQ